jgi:FixJ family two-component response regulator
MTTLNTQFVAFVDDDAQLCVAFENLLRSAGIASESFPSAEDFLHRARQEAIRCVVLDMGLPQMSGVELLRHLRANGWNLPIICITGQPDTDGRLARQILEAGAQTLLHKPFDAEELIRLLRPHVLP